MPLTSGRSWNREETLSCESFSFAVVIIGLLVFKQPDMGTSAILIAIAFFLYILAGLPTLMVIGTILIGAVGAVVGVVMLPTG